MTLWIIFASLCLIALAFVVWPLYRSSGRLTPLLATVIVLVVGCSAALYNEIGQPSVSSAAATSVPDTDNALASLAERLEDNPDDVDGWTLLARSYQSTQQYDAAISAFEKVLELEQGQNALTMISLAIVLMESQGGAFTDRSSGLFEDALALQPDDPNTLFYAGSAAAQRGDFVLAADRWEVLLQEDTPPEVREMLQAKINEWRGLPPPEAPAKEAMQPIVSLNLLLSEAATAALPADARVYIIARDPMQPSPPIAVAPRQLADLPLRVDLDDSNAMMQGRPLSGFAELEVVARVSLTGSPAAQSGDWFGSLIVSANSGQTIDLLIDQEVP